MELEGIFSLIKRVHNIFSPQNILGGRGGQCLSLGFLQEPFSQANKKIKYKKNLPPFTTVKLLARNKSGI